MHPLYMYCTLLRNNYIKIEILSNLLIGLPDFEKKLFGYVIREHFAIYYRKNHFNLIEKKIWHFKVLLRPNKKICSFPVAL